MKAEIKPRIDFEGRTRLETVIPLSTPYLVFLDPSDLCNFHCSFCPTGNKKLINRVRKSQLMPFGLFQKIIDDLCTMPEPIKTLRLYKDGEALLNPDFPNMVKYAKLTGRFGQVDVTTNGSLLRPLLNNQIINAGLDKIFISVPVDYSLAYIKNIKHFYENSRGKCEVYVKIIGEGMKEASKIKFMSDFGDISDRIFIENLVSCFPEYEVEKANQTTGIYGNDLTQVEVCSYLFYSLSINSNGTVSACFLDWSRKLILGDLNKDKFTDIWNGKALRDLRIAHLTWKRSSLEVCRDCRQLQFGAPDLIDEYADMILERI